MHVGRKMVESTHDDADVSTLAVGFFLHMVQPAIAVTSTAATSTAVPATPVPAAHPAVAGESGRRGEGVCKHKQGVETSLCWGT